MKRNYNFSVVFSVFLILIAGCGKNTVYKEQLKDPELFLTTMKELTDVIVHDIFSPPVASRVYAYPSIAAYEAMRPAYPEKYRSLSGQLKGLDTIPQSSNKDIDYHLASIHAFLLVSKSLIFSEDKIETYQNALYKNLKKNGLPNSIYKSSIAYGEQVANHILAWADKDMYKQTRSFPKYTIIDEDKLWKPTPPDYMAGIEPHWKEIRPMVLDSSGQFPPLPPVDFDLDSNSEFYRQLKEVYDVGTALNDDQVDIARFWDCNPYVSHHQGHAMFATKKITPGGHWIGITAIACREDKSSFDQAIEAHALVSATLFDAFISCWDEKWRSLLVRPETLINQHIDEDWLPLLQTPPFPEYTSGHSVVSRAAAITLTNIFGENFAFNDTTEVEYGLPPRKFDNFLQASEEAAISRLYGGIHYMMAIENGVTQGEQVGKHFIEQIRTRQ